MMEHGMESLGLNELRDEAWRISREHGFTDMDIPADLMLIVTECAEAMEDHRNGLGVDVYLYKDARGIVHNAIGATNEARKPVGIPSELADVLSCFVGSMGSTSSGPFRKRWPTIRLDPSNMTESCYKNLCTNASHS